MVRETSIEAYRKIEEDGLLSKRRFEVYDFIAHNEPCSINKMLASKAWVGRNTGSLTGRISELKERCVITEAGFEIATTGHRVTLWKTTGGLPIEPPPKETNKQIIQRLSARIADLEQKLQNRP